MYQKEILHQKKILIYKFNRNKVHIKYALYPKNRQEEQKLSELKKLLKISEEWKLEFKGDLLENVLNNYNSIVDFIEIVIDEWINVWKEENPDLIDIYEKFEKKLLALDKEKLEHEYQVVYLERKRNS